MDTEVVWVGEPIGVQKREEEGWRSSLSHAPPPQGKN